MALVERAQGDRAIKRADDLARVAGLSVRSLHRAFERYVGVGPKWVIRRARVHEAAERVAAGESVAWGGLAHELGYHDQAHLIRDFKAQIGVTPAAYARRCAGLQVAVARRLEGAIVLPKEAAAPRRARVASDASTAQHRPRAVELREPGVGTEHARLDARVERLILDRDVNLHHDHSQKGRLDEHLVLHEGQPPQRPRQQADEHDHAHGDGGGPTGGDAEGPQGAPVAAIICVPFGACGGHGPPATGGAYGMFGGPGAYFE
jgi:AraC-like DNA-binding protein